MKIKMNKILISFIGFFFLASCSSTLNKNNQQPKWMSETYRKSFFPADQFYIHFEEKKLSDFSSKSPKDIKIEFGRDMETQLVKQIVEKISFSTSSSELQTENKKIDYISSVLRESTQSASATLIGKHEEYHIDKSNKSISAIIYVKKSDLAKGYKSTINSKIEILKGKIDHFLTNNLQDENLPLSEINTEIKTIQNEIEIYTIILSSTDSNLNEIYNNMYASFLKLSSIYGNDTKKIESLIIEADQLYRSQSSFESIIAKLNEALLYDTSNIKVISKINDYKSKWTANLTSELNTMTNNKEFLSAIKILDKLVVVDQNNDSVYREKQKNLIAEYFTQTITSIKTLLKNGMLSEGIKQLNDITKYSYIDIDEYNSVKSQLDAVSIDNAIRDIQNYIYEKNYDVAASLCKSNLILYPNNKQLKQLFNQVLNLIEKNKKTELLLTRSTRYVVEFNYSLSNSPEIIFDKNAMQTTNLNISKIDFNNQLGCFQIGLYKKINIKDKRIKSNGKHKFSYSQIGFRGGQLDFSKSSYPLNNYNTPTIQTTSNYKQISIKQIEASFIWRRFFMFNLGYLTETISDTSIGSVETKYFCSTVGLRIPFDFIHLTADVTGFSDGNAIAKVYAKAGISINIGLNKKFNGEDKKYITNEVSKLRNN